MRNLFLLIVVMGIRFGYSQSSYEMSWSDEMKLKKGGTNLSILNADETGLYFSQERKIAAVAEDGAPPVYTLYKLDKQFRNIFEKEYKKELKGLNFQSFQTLGKDLYLFATDYIKKEKVFKLFGAKIDKNTGELAGGFKELGSYALETHRDNYEVKVSPIQGGESFLIVTNISVPNKFSAGISLVNSSLEKTDTTVISLSFDPSLYQLEDVRYTNSNKIILLGREYEEVAFGKRRRMRPVFKQYHLAIYNTKAEKEKEVSLTANSRFVISGKLIEQQGGELLLAGFYSNTAGKSDLSGFFINRIDPEKGELLLSSYKEINPAMMGKSFADEAEEAETNATKALPKDAGDYDEEELPNNFLIRSVDINPADQSIIISSEIARLNFSSYYTQRYNTMTRTFTNNWNYLHRFITRDILLISADKNGNINWMNAMPKSQLEDVKTNESGFATGFNYFYTTPGYFSPPGGMPFYSSYKSLLLKNRLILLFNDHSSNHINAEYGDPVKTVSNFRKKSNIYGVSVDLATGKLSRREVLAPNNEETILMPRHAFVVGNQFIVPSWRQHLVAKTELKFAKILVK